MRKLILNRSAGVFLVAFLLAAFFLIATEALGMEAAIVYRSGDPEGKRAAITVDDCRNINVMTAMLDLFEENDVKATFYVIGRNLRAEDRAFWQRVLAEGHEIGNHTYGHIRLNRLAQKDVLAQLHKTQSALDEVLGFSYPMGTVRPPYGQWRGISTLRYIYQAGYDSVILWSVSHINPVTAYSQIKNGSICLYHSNIKDLRCLETLIPRLREDGFELVTVSQLLGLGEGVPVDEKNSESPQKPLAIFEVPVV